MRRTPYVFRWAVALCGLATILYFVPLFHVVPLEATRQQDATSRFDAATFVDAFWEGKLPEAAQRAVDASELLAALQRDAADAAERFGHRLGLGGNVFYFVSGQGRIAAIDGSITITLPDNPADIVIETGPVFGNAIRDGSGLVDVSEFANAQDFNAVSSEINRRVEEQVLPLLEENAEPGKEVRFVGGAEVPDSTQAPSSLVVVPVIIEFL